MPHETATAEAPARQRAGRPRVALVGLGWDRPGGMNTYVRDLRAALADHGMAPQVVVLGPAASAPHDVVVAADEGDPLPVRLARTAGAARRAAAGADVVDAHFAMGAFWPVVVGRLRHRPLVVHFHGPWADESVAAGAGGPAVAVKRAVERAVYRRARAVVVLSEAFGRLVVERYGVDPARVRVVAPGTDLERFTPDRDGARRRLDLPQGAGIVFAARRLVPRMGLDVLLRAWSQVAGDGRLLVIAGEGPSRADLERQVRDLGLEASVRLVGRIDDDALVDHYRAADLSVVPSLGLEGFGLVVLESLACGTPVVASDVGGLPEALAGFGEDLVVPAGDVVALAGRLGRALDGDVPSAEACRAHAERFSWSASAARHEAVYAEAAAPARLRVLFLDHCAELSGGEIALLRLAPALDVDATVLLAEDGPLVERLRAAGVAVEVAPMAEAARGMGRDRVQAHRLPLATVLHTGRYVARLTLRLRRERPDVVHANSLKAALYGGVAARLAGVPMVWHVRDRIADDYLPAQAVRLVRAAARWLPAAVIANSHITLATVAPPGAPRPPATVVPDPYAPPPAPAAPAHEGLVIGVVGRLSSWKGQHVAIEALHRAFPDGGARLRLVGSPMFGEEAYEAELRALVARLGLGDRVELTGFRADVEAELAGLDVLVHASVLPEPFGQVVVEGLAAGLPVVAATPGGPAEIITDGVDGLLTPAGDVDALAGALRRLAADADLRRRLGDAARVRAADFVPAVIAPQVEAVYRSLLRA